VVGRKAAAKKKNSRFLGLSLVQDQVVAASSMRSMQEPSTEAFETQPAVHVSIEL